ncbi:hypothetical protein BHS09_33070 [Myxococcus xanthus]|uniref:Uncharacterized protein n=1 Tax=Myxococcus xanthus TaxID=34 RepID=A0AAE6G5P4_MYXXA|nr:hypothetical protein BHS09_33070 [Myxococcus xanthus]QDE78708.1 hypothetical protein BHS08_33090 [Myxococcus xanthus]
MLGTPQVRPTQIEGGDPIRGLPRPAKSLRHILTDAVSVLEMECDIRLDGQRRDDGLAASANLLVLLLNQTSAPWDLGKSSFARCT